MTIACNENPDSPADHHGDHDHHERHGGQAASGTVTVSVDSLQVPAAVSVVANGATALRTHPAKSGIERRRIQRQGTTTAILYHTRRGRVLRKVVEAFRGSRSSQRNPPGALTVLGATLNAGTITNSRPTRRPTGPTRVNWSCNSIASFLGPMSTHVCGSAVESSHQMIVDAPSGGVRRGNPARRGGAFSPSVSLIAPAGLSVHDIGKVEVASRCSSTCCRAATATQEPADYGVIDGEAGNVRMVAAGDGGWRSWDTVPHIRQRQQPGKPQLPRQRAQPLAQRHRASAANRPFRSR